MNIVRSIVCVADAMSSMSRAYAVSPVPRSSNELPVPWRRDAARAQDSRDRGLLRSLRPDPGPAFRVVLRPLGAHRELAPSDGEKERDGDEGNEDEAEKPRESALGGSARSPEARHHHERRDRRCDRDHVGEEIVLEMAVHRITV